MYIEYTINARKVERKFKREMTKRGYFETAKGCVNKIVDYGKSYVSLMSTKGEEPFQIKRTSIRKAISIFFFKRTAVRKDFNRFSFTSALFAIIMHCFKDKAKLQRLRNGLFRISLLGCRFFSSGLERDPAILKVLKEELNGKYVLFNYKSILESPQCLNWLVEYDLYAVIDSGAFSFFNSKRSSLKDCQQQQLFDEEYMEELILEGYARFINENKHNPRILGFFPLDRIGDPIATKKNYKRLKELTNANIYPVWQITDTLEELDQLVKEEPEMIALGGAVPFLSTRKHMVREILEKVTKRHPTVAFHGLGIADELLQEFQLFSADSTAFLNARKWKDGRKVYLPNGERINAPSDMSTMDIIKQNLKYLIGLESLESSQIAFNDTYFTLV